jgi:hypothetical protein
MIFDIEWTRMVPGPDVNWVPFVSTQFSEERLDNRGIKFILKEGFFLRPKTTKNGLQGGAAQRALRKWNRPFLLRKRRGKDLAPSAV